MGTSWDGLLAPPPPRNHSALSASEPTPLFLRTDVPRRMHRKHYPSHCISPVLRVRSVCPDCLVRPSQASRFVSQPPSHHWRPRPSGWSKASSFHRHIQPASSTRVTTTFNFPLKTKVVYPYFEFDRPFLPSFSPLIQANHSQQRECPIAADCFFASCLAPP